MMSVQIRPPLPVYAPIAQTEERYATNVKAGDSSSSGRTSSLKRDCSSMVEHRTVTAKAVGSVPTSPAINKVACVNWQNGLFAKQESLTRDAQGRNLPLPPVNNAAVVKLE